MYRLLLVNFGTAFYFNTLEEAREKCKKYCFEAIITLNGIVLVTFSPISGFSTPVQAANNGLQD